LNSALQILGSWDVDDLTLGSTVSCVRDGKIYVSGLDNVAEINADAISVKSIPAMNRSNGYRIFDIGAGCLALFGKINTLDKSIMDGGVIDIGSGRVLSEFSRQIHADILLSSDGKKLLEHVRSVVEVVDPDLPAYVTDLTRQFKLIDTSNGNTLLETTLEIDNARIVGGQTCDGNEPERIVLTDSDTVYLLDLNTLTVIHSQKVPFMGHLAL